MERTVTAPVFPNYGAGKLKVACPGDEQDTPPWFLRFSDPDIREQVFTGEGAAERAWEAWNRFAPAYNCYLLTCPPIPELTDAQLEANALLAFETIGGKIDQLGGNCPVQGEGSIDGKRFYFRARGTSWQWHVAETDAELWDNSLLYIERSYSDEQFAAGWMPVHEALGFMVEGARLWKLQFELWDAYEGEGNAERVTFLQWIRDMAANDKGTLQEAAKRYLDGIHDQ
jgi:hypothetical protein